MCLIVIFFCNILFFILFTNNIMFILSIHYISTENPRAFKCKEIICPHFNGEIDPTKCVGQYKFGSCCPEKYLCGELIFFFFFFVINNDMIL